MIHSDLKSSALLTQTFAVLSKNMISISSTGTGTGTDLLSTGYNQWRGQREFKVGRTSLASRLSACLTEANWWRLIAE